MNPLRILQNLILTIIVIVMASCGDPDNSDIPELVWEYVGLDNNIGTINSINLHPDSIGIIYVSTDYSYSSQIESFLLISKDNGNTWDTIGTSAVSGGHFLDIVFDPHNSNILYIVNGIGIFKSIDNGKSWSNITGNISINYGVYISGLTIDSSNPDIIYVTTSGGFIGTIYKSIDAGSEWNDIGPKPSKGADHLIVNTENSCNIIFSDSHGSILYSQDSGNSWHYSSINNTLLGASEILFSSDGSIYALIDYRDRIDYNYGVLRSGNNGVSFNKINSNLPKTDFRPHDIVEDTQTGDIYLMLTSMSDGMTQIYILNNNSTEWILLDEWNRSMKLKGVLQICPHSRYLYRGQEGIYKSIINK